jgi:anti-sigma B factor antagonist
MKTESIKIEANFSVEAAAAFRDLTYGLIEKDAILFDIDFSQCVFLDSTGLGVLVGLYKKCAENHSDMILRNLSTDVRKLFQMTRLDQIFTIR